MRHDRIEAVLLDMGGVLIPEVPGYEGAAGDAELLHALAALGIEEPETFVRTRARRVRESYRELETSSTQPDLDKVLGEDSAPVRKLLLGAFRRQATQRPYAHARRVVAKLARSYRLGLVSNNVIPGDHHARALGLAGILKHIECPAWSANFGLRKPDPSIIHHVLDCLGVPARRAILVGDKLHTDILAAERAGVRSVYLRKPGSPFEGAARPDFTIQHLGALPGLLRRIG